MIKETGKVVAIEKQYANKIAIVECISKSACSSCHNNGNCGVGTVSKAFSDKTHQFEVPFQEGMEVDKFIELQINNSDLIKGASLAYLLPLLFFIAGALTIKQFSSVNELVTIVTAVICGAIGFIVTRIISNKIYSKEQLNCIIPSNLDK